MSSVKRNEAKIKVMNFNKNLKNITIFIIIYLIHLFIIIKVSTL